MWILYRTNVSHYVGWTKVSLLAFGGLICRTSVHFTAIYITHYLNEIIGEKLASFFPFQSLPISIFCTCVSPCFCVSLLYRHSKHFGVTVSSWRFCLPLVDWIVLGLGRSITAKHVDVALVSVIRMYQSSRFLMMLQQWVRFSFCIAMFGLAVMGHSGIDASLATILQEIQSNLS